MAQSYSFSSLRKKQWRRSPQWETKLIVRILVILFSIYMLACFLMIGAGGYFILEKRLPDQTPIQWVNQYLFYYLGLEWLVRFLMQQLPITHIQQFILLPISKRSIVKNVMRRSLLSAFNSSLLVLFLPFAIVLALKENHILATACWWLGVSFLVLTIGNLNFLVNKGRWFYPTILFFLLSVLFEQIGLFSVAKLLGKGMQYLYENPLALIIPALIFLGSYLLTFRFLKRNFYLDTALEKRKEKRWGGELKSLDRFGLLGKVLKNDIRLIFRNIRVRQVLSGALMFLLYGLIFFPQTMYEKSAMEVFAALFTTGGFLMMFSQNVPAWDSSYFKLLQVQRLSMFEYLLSKWMLFVFSILIGTILTLPYLYFGQRVYAAILAGSIFNAGLGTIIGLISGALNHTPVKLEVRAKAFENTQNFNLTQLLFVLPKLALPMLIFWLPYHYLGYTEGLIALSVVGLLGLLFTRPLLKYCALLYEQKKHEMIQGFDKNE